MILHLLASAHGKTQQTTRVGYMMHNIAPRQSSAFMGEDHTPQDRSSNHVSYCGVLLSLLALATSRFEEGNPGLESGWIRHRDLAPSESWVMGSSHHGLPPPILVSGWRVGHPGQTWMESVTARKGTGMRGPRCLLTERLCMVDQRRWTTLDTESEPETTN